MGCPIRHSQRLWNPSVLRLNTQFLQHLAQYKTESVSRGSKDLKNYTGLVNFFKP